MSPKTKGRDYTQVMMFGAAMVVVIRYAGAFFASDMGEITGTLSEWVTAFMLISGVGMGFLVVFGQAYAFDGWKRSMPKTGQRATWRFVLLTLVVFLLIVMDVSILVPFTVSRIRHESISAVLGGGDWLWSISVNVAPALLLAGVMLGNSVVATTQIETHGTTANNANGSQNGSGRKYKDLTNSEKYLIINTNSSVVAKELGVTPRAVQKWRVKVQEEVVQGKL